MCMPSAFTAAQNTGRTLLDNAGRTPDAISISINQIPAGLPPGSFDHINGLEAASATTTGATATAAATTAATLTGLRFVHLEGAAPKVFAIERLHGARGVRIGHLDESEPARAPGITVRDERQRLNGAVRSEQRADRILSRGEG